MSGPNDVMIEAEIQSTLTRLNQRDKQIARLLYSKGGVARLSQIASEIGVHRTTLFRYLRKPIPRKLTTLSGTTRNRRCELSVIGAKVAEILWEEEIKSFVPNPRDMKAIKPQVMYYRISDGVVRHLKTTDLPPCQFPSGNQLLFLSYQK